MLDHEVYLEAELMGAPRSPSNQLFHYTNADAAIFGILSSGTLRMSPFESTNDLWESRPLYPNLTVHHDDRETNEATDLWSEIDRIIRLHSKVACLTQDWDLPSYVTNPDALRGWNHLSLWAHYGGGHTGICLRFDRDKLIRCFETASTTGTLHRFHGPVTYLSTSVGVGPYGIDVGQAKEFGIDAISIAYAESYKDQVFFRKHRDWANEAEYRFVLMDQSVLPACFPIRDALTGVFLGDAFSRARLPALLAVLDEYPGVEILQLRFHNRHLMHFPFSGTESSTDNSGQPLSRPSNRPGSLAERVAALKESTQVARERRERAKGLSSELMSKLENEIHAIGAYVQSWPNVNVEAIPSAVAIPEHQRSRSPGVLGEQVHFEGGYMCIVENLPKYSHTLVAAAGAQVLDDDLIRVHAVVTIEHWRQEGNERTEHWRGCREVPLAGAESAAAALMLELKNAVETARLEFNLSRAQQEE